MLFAENRQEAILLVTHFLPRFFGFVIVTENMKHGVQKNPNHFIFNRLAVSVGIFENLWWANKCFCTYLLVVGIVKSNHVCNKVMLEMIIVYLLDFYFRNKMAVKMKNHVKSKGCVIVKYEANRGPGP